MEVIETQPEIDTLRLVSALELPDWKRVYSQADLGALVGCSNNHMSHVEVGQTKVSLAMLLNWHSSWKRTLTNFYWIPHMQNATASLIMRLLQTEKV